MKLENKQISNIAWMGVFINTIYYNGNILWSIVNNIFNCFSSGIWYADKMWTNSDLWKS